MSQPPFFLAGADRTGIGLLADILDRHPDVAISRRLNFWTFYDGRFGPLDDPANLERCLDDMWRFRRVQDLDVGRGAVERRFLENGDLSYSGLFTALEEAHAEAVGKSVWGDKSLNAERHAERIFDYFPEARMIHVLRDPRDRHVSVMTHRGGKRGGVFGTTAVWVDSERRAALNSASFGGRYQVVKYEDLVERPTETLGSVCDLIGVPYQDSLLGGITSSVGPRSTLDEGSVGRYLREATQLQIATIQSLARVGMIRRGYHQDDRPLQTLDRIRVKVLTVPIGWLIIRAWRPWALVKSRLSRGPSPRRLTSPTRGDSTGEVENP